MDNAGGGRRGLRAAPTQELLAVLSDQYGLICESEPRDLGGSSNLNLLVSAAGARWVVRVYRPYVTPARLTDICRVTVALAGAGVPCAIPRLSRQGQPWVAWNNRLLTVEPYMPHDGRMMGWPRLAQGMTLLGRMHTLMAALTVSADGESPPFANYVSPHEALAATRRGVRRIRDWGPTAAESRLADDAEALAERVWAAEREVVSQLPQQLVHGDFWDNNVLLTGERIVLVTDLDFAGVRARIDDLALTLFYACVEPPLMSASKAQLAQVRALVDAYDAAVIMPLSPLERWALPLAIARQPLWSIGVWVAELDDEQAARRHANACADEVAWALRLMQGIERWQAALA